MKIKVLAYILLLSSCTPRSESIEMHKTAKLASSINNSVCYSIIEPEEIKGKYCLEYIKEKYED